VSGQLAEAVLADLDGDALDRLAELLAPRLPGIVTAPARFTEPLLTCAEAASRARTHVETIRRAIRSGALRAYHVGREWRIAPADLDAWLNLKQPRERLPRPGVRRPSTRGRPLADALSAIETAPRASYDGRQNTKRPGDADTSPAMAQGSYPHEQD
jgi:excisionase family DNA binding protein